LLHDLFGCEEKESVIYIECLGRKRDQTHKCEDGEQGVRVNRRPVGKEGPGWKDCT
jgi:hypothetical protein